MGKDSQKTSLDSPISTILCQGPLSETNVQKCKKRKKHKKYRSTKIKNTWAPAFSTKKQNRLKTQKTKKIQKRKKKL